MPYLLRVPRGSRVIAQSFRSPSRTLIFSIRVNCHRDEPCACDVPGTIAARAPRIFLDFRPRPVSSDEVRRSRGPNALERLTALYAIGFNLRTQNVVARAFTLSGVGQPVARSPLFRGNFLAFF